MKRADFERLAIEDDTLTLLEKENRSVRRLHGPDGRHWMYDQRRQQVAPCVDQGELIWENIED